MFLIDKTHGKCKMDDDGKNIFRLLPLPLCHIFFSSTFLLTANTATSTYIAPRHTYEGTV